MGEEEKINSSEIGSEHVPTLEEVHAKFQELIGKEYTEARKLEDQQGLYVFEVTIPGESEGEIIEYGYMRKGHYQGIGFVTATEIHRTYMDKNGIPYAGTSAAEFVDGEWKIIK